MVDRQWSMRVKVRTACLERQKSNLSIKIWEIWELDLKHLAFNRCFKACLRGGGGLPFSKSTDEFNL